MLFILCQFKEKKSKVCCQNLKQFIILKKLKITFCFVANWICISPAIEAYDSSVPWYQALHVISITKVKQYFWNFEPFFLKKSQSSMLLYKPGWKQIFCSVIPKPKIESTLHRWIGDCYFQNLFELFLNENKILLL